MFKIITDKETILSLIQRLPIRVADSMELTTATGGLAWQDAVRSSINLSDEVEMWLYKNTMEPVAILGLVAYSYMGVPWMVGSEKIRKHPKLVTRGGLLKVKEWLSRYEILANYVDSRNDLHVNWLKRIGFKFDPINDREYRGVPFLAFYMKGTE